jgi:hypothetical protein
MKKITFILFALVAGTTFAQTTVSSTAEIIEAITFEETSDLSFGRVDNTAGFVTIEATPAGTASGKTQVGGSTSSAALKVSGAISETYSITLSTTATLTETGGNTLPVTSINHNASTSPSLDGINGEDTFNIGGTLTLAGGETPGTYSGNIDVTVSYN